MSWFYLALLAPILYAIVNIVDDNMLHFLYKSPYLATATVSLFGALPIFSRLFLSSPSIPLKIELFAIVSGLLTSVFFFFYFKGLESDSPSIVIALLTLAPAILPFFAHFILKEVLSSNQILGFVLILVASGGLVITSIKKMTFSAALIPALVCIALIDTASIVTKYVYQKGPFYPGFIFFSVGLGIGGIYFSLIILFMKKWRIHSLKTLRSKLRLLPLLLFVYSLGLLADFVLNLASSRGPISLVRVMEAIQPILVLSFAILFYPLFPKYFREAKEGKLIRKISFMLVSIVGLFLIYSSTR